MGTLNSGAWAGRRGRCQRKAVCETAAGHGPAPHAWWRVAAIVALLGGLPGLGLAQEKYTLRPRAGQEFILLVEKTGLLAGKKHRFVFTDYSGSLKYVRDQPERSLVRFTVRVKSLQVTDDWVKEKDRSKIYDFALSDKMLDSQRFPELTFAATHIVPGKDSTHFRAEGTLTIHGVTRSVPVNVSVTAESPDGGNLSLEGTSSFRLSDFGLQRPSAAFGSVGTKDEVVTKFHLRSTPDGV